MKEVTLKNIETGELRAFRFDNAVDLLNYEAAVKVSCWKLPEDSNYTLTNGELVDTGSGTVNKGTEEPKRNKPRPS